jgi:hypothetical protein
MWREKHTCVQPAWSSAMARTLDLQVSWSCHHAGLFCTAWAEVLGTSRQHGLPFHASRVLGDLGGAPSKPAFAAKANQVVGPLSAGWCLSSLITARPQNADRGFFPLNSTLCFFPPPRSQAFGRQYRFFSNLQPAGSSPPQVVSLRLELSLLFLPSSIRYHHHHPLSFILWNQGWEERV